MYDLENTVEIEDFKDLLKLTTEYDMYAYYMGNQFEVGKVMKSPLRKDIHPSFGIFKSSVSGNLLWKDQGTGKTGDIVLFVATLFKLTPKNAFNKVVTDLKQGLIKITEEGKRIKESYRKSKTTISIQKKNFTETDEDYWEQYFITKEILKKHNVSPIHTFWVNETISNIFYTKEQPLYAYRVFDKYQIYSPRASNKKNKFRTSCTVYDMYGLEQLPQYGNLLIITKSNKDVMVLDRLGYDAISPTGESTPIPVDIMQNLRERFKRIVVLYDNDESGMNGAKKLSSTNHLEYVCIPVEYYTKFKIKDISDFIKAYKITKTKQLLKDLLNEKG